MTASQPSPPAARATPAAPAAAEPSIGELVSQASEHLSTLVTAQIDLAKLELRTSVKNAGIGGGMFAGAAVVFVFSLTFGFFALAEGLIAAGLWPWAAFLVVFGLLLVVVALLAFLGARKAKRVKGPERTIDAGKETVAYLREHAPRG